MQICRRLWQAQAFFFACTASLIFLFFFDKAAKSGPEALKVAADPFCARAFFLCGGYLSNKYLSKNITTDCQ